MLGYPSDLATASWWLFHISSIGYCKNFRNDDASWMSKDGGHPVWSYLKYWTSGRPIFSWCEKPCIFMGLSQFAPDLAIFFDIIFNPCDFCFYPPFMSSAWLPIGRLWSILLANLIQGLRGPTSGMPGTRIFVAKSPNETWCLHPLALECETCRAAMRTAWIA